MVLEILGAGAAAFIGFGIGTWIQRWFDAKQLAKEKNAWMKAFEIVLDAKHEESVKLAHVALHGLETAQEIIEHQEDVICELKSNKTKKRQ